MTNTTTTINGNNELIKEIRNINFKNAFTKRQCQLFGLKYTNPNHWCDIQILITDFDKFVDFIIASKAVYSFDEIIELLRSMYRTTLYDCLKKNSLNNINPLDLYYIKRIARNLRIKYDEENIKTQTDKNGFLVDFSIFGDRKARFFVKKSDKEKTDYLGNFYLNQKYESFIQERNQCLYEALNLCVSNLSKLGCVEVAIQNNGSTYSCYNICNLERLVEHLSRSCFADFKRIRELNFTYKGEEFCFDFFKRIDNRNDIKSFKIQTDKLRRLMNLDK